jgi:orotidine-5'-phosphate decarboxylase
MARLELKPKERIILALDFTELRIAKFWVESLKSRIRTFKVGPILFLDAGPIGIKEFRDFGAEVFLDLKFHDIPNTVEHSGRQAVRYGVKMFTVHALGGLEMMKAVSEAVADEAANHDKHKPLVLAVTVLTSHDEESLKSIGINTSTLDTVLNLASLADKAGVDGLVCSGMEVEMLRNEFGDRFTLVVPGIRPAGDKHDQKRVTTPAQAIASGADYIVIGRAITEAENPEAVVDEIVKSV